MQSPNVLRAVAALAPGKRVTIITSGKSYDLPPKPAPVPVDPPHPFEEVSKQMLERDAEIRALITSLAERTDGALSQVKEVVSTVAAGHAEVVKSVEENTRTLRLPNEPVYNDAGKLIGTRRVENLRG